MSETTESVLAGLAEIFEAIRPSDTHAGKPAQPPPDLRKPGALERNVMEMGIDSLSAATLVVAIEERFHIELPPLLLAEVQTIGELVGVIQRLQGES